MANTEENSTEDRPFKKKLWSWFMSFGVLLTSTLSMTMSIGLCTSLSVFIVEFIEYFQESKFLVSWCNGIPLALDLISAPLWMVALTRFSHRQILTVGFTLSSLGIFLSSFATSIYHHYICLGLIAGLGFGMLNFIALIYPNEYFVRRKFIALGIASAGAGLGAMILPIILRTFIVAYTWRGALQLTAAISAQMIMLTLFLQPLHKKQKRISKNKIYIQHNDSSRNKQMSSQCSKLACWCCCSSFNNKLTCFKKKNNHTLNGIDNKGYSLSGESDVKYITPIVFSIQTTNPHESVNVNRGMRFPHEKPCTLETPNNTQLNVGVNPTHKSNIIAEINSSLNILDNVSDVNDNVSSDNTENVCCKTEDTQLHVETADDVRHINFNKESNNISVDAKDAGDVTSLHQIHKNHVDSNDVGTETLNNKNKCIVLTDANRVTFCEEIAHYDNLVDIDSDGKLKNYASETEHHSTKSLPLDTHQEKLDCLLNVMDSNKCDKQSSACDKTLNTTNNQSKIDDTFHADGDQNNVIKSGACGNVANEKIELHNNVTKPNKTFLENGTVVSKCHLYSESDTNPQSQPSISNITQIIIENEVLATYLPGPAQNLKLLMRDWKIYVFALYIFTQLLAISVYTTFNMDYFLNIGIDHETSVVLVTFSGMGNLIGRLSASVSQLVDSKRVLIHVVSGILFSISCFLLGYVETSFMYSFLALIIGWCFGLIASATPMVTLELFGIGKLREALALIFVSFGAGMLVGPPIGGKVFDINQSFYNVFLMTAIVSLVASFIAATLLLQLKSVKSFSGKLCNKN